MAFRAGNSSESRQCTRLPWVHLRLRRGAVVTFQQPTTLDVTTAVGTGQYTGWSTQDGVQMAGRDFRAGFTNRHLKF